MGPDPPPQIVGGSSKSSSRRYYGATAKKSAIWSFSSVTSYQALTFVMSIFLARLLTPEDFGITAAARFFITLATRVTQLGLNVSLVRMKEVRQEHCSSVFVVNLVLGVLAFLTLWGASSTMASFFGSPAVGSVLPVSATVFLIVPFGTVAAAMLTRQLRYRTSVMIAWCDAVFGALLTLVLAWFGWGYWSLVGGALVATAGSTAAKVWFSPFRPSLRFSMPALRETLTFGLGFQARRLLVFATTNLDNLVVGKLLGIVNLGFYDKGYGLMHQLTNRMAFDGSFMRIFSIIREEPDRFRRALMKGVQATSLISFPMLVFVAAGADHIVVALFGPQWEPAIGPFRVLACVGLLRSASRTVSMALEALGMVWLQTGVQVVSLSSMVAGVAVGSHWGLTGAAAGVLLASVIETCLNVWLLTRSSSVTPLDLLQSCWPSFATGSVVGAAIVGVNAGLRAASVTNDWVCLGADCAVAAVLYAVLLLWTPFASVRAVIKESVDDVAPWLRRICPVGVLRLPTPDRVQVDVPGRQAV